MNANKSETDTLSKDGLKTFRKEDAKHFRIEGIF